MTNDNNHTYTWNADGHAITVDSGLPSVVTLTYDALGRNRSEKRHPRERLNPRNRRLLRLPAEALALQQNHGRLSDPDRTRLSTTLADLDRPPPASLPYFATF